MMGVLSHWSQLEECSTVIELDYSTVNSLNSRPFGESQLIPNWSVQVYLSVNLGNGLPVIGRLRSQTGRSITGKSINGSDPERDWFAQ